MINNGLWYVVDNAIGRLYDSGVKSQTNFKIFLMTRS